MFRETEIIVCPFPPRQSDLKSFHSQDLDFDGENRTVVLEGTVSRKEKNPSREWRVNSSAKLLDHYCVCVPIRLFGLMEVSVILTEKWINTDPVTEVDTGKYVSTSIHQPSTSGSPSVNPSEWTIEHVIEWARNRGFDEGICAKFQGPSIPVMVLQMTSCAPNRVRGNWRYPP